MLTLLSIPLSVPERGGKHINKAEENPGASKLEKTRLTERGGGRDLGIGCVYVRQGLVWDRILSGQMVLVSLCRKGLEAKDLHLLVSY